MGPKDLCVFNLHNQLKLMNSRGTKHYYHTELASYNDIPNRKYSECAFRCINFLKGMPFLVFSLGMGWVGQSW